MILLYKCNLEKVLAVASVICQLLTSGTLAYIYIAFIAQLVVSVEYS